MSEKKAEDEHSEAQVAAPVTSSSSKPVNDLDYVEKAYGVELKTLDDKLFVDIFRRADKNDDGKVSFEEFISHFQDDHLSLEELHNLFKSIDKDENGIIDVDELVGYFKQGFDPYRPLFTFLENSHYAVSQALIESSQNYSQGSWFDQFKIRYLFKEFLRQLETLHEPVMSALNYLEATTPIHLPAKRVPVLNLENNLPLHPHLSPRPSTRGESRGLEAQVDRLAAFLNRLEMQSFKLNIISIEESIEEYERLLLISREFEVDSSSVSSFKDAAKTYLEVLQTGEISCLFSQLSEIGLSDFVLYEIWTSEEERFDFYRTDGAKAFSKALIDVLKHPEHFKSMVVPSQWFSSRKE